MIKKIGIITVHNSPNYGACLQSYALWKYLCLLGYDCEIIDLHRPYQEDYVSSKKYERYRKPKVSLKTHIKKIVKAIFFTKKGYKLFNSLAKEKFDLFNAEIKMSRPYYGIDDLYENPPKYDLYVSGSDQLWNPSQSYCLEPYFLTFAPSSAKKISYATSIGITDLLDNEKQDFKKWLFDFETISVRENQAKTLLQSFTNYKVEVVADPTFLLDREYWKELAIYPQAKRKYILLFTLSFNKELLEYGMRLSKESGLELVYLEQCQPENVNGYTPVCFAGPREFLGYIANAEMVITTSFHCTVFSLIMGTKNFFSYIAKGDKKGSRIENLLRSYDLDSHILYGNLCRGYQDLAEQRINHDSIETTMDCIQQQSKLFLDGCLK